MRNIAIGDYVKVTNKGSATYGRIGVVVTLRYSKATVLFSDNTKYCYSFKSLSEPKFKLWSKVIGVNYKGHSYLVTPKLTIISMRTHRILNYTATDPFRIGLLAVYDSMCIESCFTEAP